MGRNSVGLDCEKIGAMGEKTTNKGKHSKKNQSGSRSFRDARYLCI